MSYAIESALAQTLDDIEVIVVDDCSKDDTLALLNERFGDNDKVRIISQPQNGGAVSELFKQEYGEKGAFVEYLYWRLHELLEEQFSTAGPASDFGELFNKTEDASKQKQNETIG